MTGLRGDCQENNEIQQSYTCGDYTLCDSRCYVQLQPIKGKLQDMIPRNGFISSIPLYTKITKAVSTFWIANPNNNLIENAAAGAQIEIGFVLCALYILHLGPWQLLLQPKACRFVCWKRSKTTRANAEDPRESPSVDNARSLPHQDANPEKPRVPAMIDGLIALKNNDHEAWARAGDIIFQNSRFSDNGIGLTLASDGTFPTDTGSAWRLHTPFLLEKTATLAPREAKTATGEKGQMENTEHCPETRSWIQESLRRARCTFKKLTLTLDRYSSAIKFFMKSLWQISPQDNVSQILMEKSDGLKVFYGRLGQWFGNSDNVHLP
ncbi:hypothetical protein HGM15179_006480 [Zosterops borbonicus]|uniref:CEMIP beta-helix domain-containing protein n=1 Tax=Zosterops borbonicus TaxID=364589 RepID=A0A8K1LNV3_9PASS|nr:hypothetical protein HGM15179_006480 [Zosterops borbonicus]